MAIGAEQPDEPRSRAHSQDAEVTRYNQPHQRGQLATQRARSGPGAGEWVQTAAGLGSGGTEVVSFLSSFLRAELGSS